MKVRCSTQYGIAHGGEVYGEGDEFEMPEAKARPLIMKGRLEAVEKENFHKLTHAELDELVATDHRFASVRKDYESDWKKDEKVEWIEKALSE